MSDEGMSPDEIKSLAVAVVTSALGARDIDNIEDRIKQYGNDFTMLVQDMTGVDLFRLSSLLADMSGFLVTLWAHSEGLNPEEAMQFLAQQMLSSEIAENE